MGLLDFFRKKPKEEFPLYYVEQLYKNYSYVIPVNDRFVSDEFFSDYQELKTWCKENSFREPLFDTVFYDDITESWTSNTFGYDKVFIATNDKDSYLLGLLRWG